MSPALVRALTSGFAAVVASAAPIALAASAAANYPTKPIRLVVTYPPGGNTDLVGRAVAQKLGEAWGQQVVVDNRGGAGGDPASSTPQALTAYMREETVRWTRVIKTAGIKIE